jgi:hypothetical protein
MKFNKIIIISIAAVIALCCQSKMSKEEIIRIGIEQCARQPLFVLNEGFNPSKSAFSTTQPNINGLVLIEATGIPSDTNFKYYRHPSWKKMGNMGSITTGADGTIYTAPVPKINTLERPLSKMNVIYKVNHITGQMTELCILPKADTTTGVVPYAVMGVFYDCHSGKLYASSVAGSSADNENGAIYLINPISGEIEDEYKGIDCIGLFVTGITGEKRLYLGSARSSDIYSIEINKEGKFIGKHKIEFTLDQLGPRGDDKARRIRIDGNGNFLIFGVEFNFSLAAPTVIPQSIYQFGFNSENNKWELITISQ